MGNDMNKIYKTVWNASLACVQVVSELAIGHQSSGGVAGTVQLGLQRFAFFNLALLPMMVLAAVNPNALPQGGNITQGSGQIQQQGNVLNIQQNSQNLHTQWNSFNIGKDATVNFKQPNRASVAVNQVLDNNASQIMGRLNANGQVFLLNPNGVIFSKTAQVNVGGLVASTLKLSEQDALTGRFKLQGDAKSHARVENHGSIIANGGTVALIAPNVVNTGSINTPNGVTHITSANQVTLALQDGTLTQFQVDQGVVQGLVDNQGAIVADNGAVYLTAKGKDALSRAVVNHSGIIEANRLSHNAKGEVILLADMQTGQTNVSGRISAQGMNEQDGGFIETSAATVKIADSASITTLSAQGKTGLWLIDPTDFTIAVSGGDMAGSILSSSLNSTDVKIESTQGQSGTDGNIYVNDAVSWSASSDLTLSAQNNIYINKDITSTDTTKTAGLNLEYGLASVKQDNQSDYYLAKGVKVNLQAGDNFSTKLGSDGSTMLYTVITDLGKAGSTTGKDLQGINGGLTKKYVLGTDIDANTTSTWNANAGFKPLGNDTTQFTGRFDGLGHSITGLTINRPNESLVGLFGYTNGSDIRNVHLQGVNVKGGSNAGGLVGYNKSGAISNSSAEGNVSANATGGYVSAGGLVGQNSGKISNSSATGNVSATGGAAYAGGLMGWNDSGVISNSSAKGNVSATGASYASAGGLVGQSWHGEISNSSAEGNVSANATGGYAYAGGLVGRNEDEAISNSSAIGKVSATGAGASVGGLVGLNDNGAISNSSATGDVSAKSTGVYAYVGGLIGKNANANVADSNADGNVTVSIHQAAANTALLQGQVFAGGLIGEQYATQANVLSNVKANGDVSVIVHANSVSEDYQNTKMETLVYTGGLIGKNTNTNKLGLVKNAVSNGKVTAQLNAFSQSAPAYGTTMQTKALIGGLIGHNEGVILENIEATGSVSANINSEALDANTVQTDVYVGGLIGLNQNSTVTGSQAQGNVIATLNSEVTNANAAHTQAYAGGLIGKNIQGIVTQAKAQGKVDAHADITLQRITEAATKLGVGGGIGHNQDSDITQMAALGAVQGVLQDASKNTTLNHTLHVGGLIGENQASKISQANAGGSVSALQNTNNRDGNFGSNTYAGGLIAQNQFGPMNNVFSTGQVTANTVSQVQNVSTTYYTFAGGLVGHNANAAVAEAHALGEVKALQNVHYRHASVAANHVQAGGLLGWNSAADVTNAFAQGDVLAHLKHDGQNGNTNIKVHAAGLIASNQNSQLNQIHALGDVNNQVDLVAPSSLSISGPARFVGGLVGENQNSAVSNAYAAGDLIHKIDLDLRNIYVATDDYIGGLIGKNQNSDIKDSKASGHIDITNDLVVNSAGGKAAIYAGGLVGHNQNSNIERSNAVGNVGLTQNNEQANASFGSYFYLGGLLGHNQESNVHDSHASGNISAASTMELVSGSPNSEVYIGGLIGNNQQTSHVVGSSAEGNVAASGDYVNYQSSWTAYTGGLIGKNSQSKVDLSQAQGDVSSVFKTKHQNGSMGANLYTGGLIGQNQNGQINQVEAVGGVDATITITTNNASGSPNVYTGGLIGENNAAQISNAIAKGDVSLNSMLTTRDSSYAIGLATGGLIGKNHANSTLKDVQALGQVDVVAEINSYRANSQLSVAAGGLIGDNQNSFISNGSSSGAVRAHVKTGFGVLPVDITVNTDVGGLVGKNTGSNIKQSHATGHVLANVVSTSDFIQANVGGLVGSQQSNSISHSHATGAVELNTTLNTLGANSNSEFYISTGGLVGKSHQVALSDVYASGTVSSSAQTQSDNFSDVKNYKTNLFAHTGGLIGQSIESQVVHVSALGAVDASLDATVNAFASIQVSAGGLIGSLASNSSVVQSYATGNVNHTHKVAGGAPVNGSTGGLVGLLGDSKIGNAYAVGAVAGVQNVGGLVGSHLGSGSIAQTYATGLVTGTGVDVGGLVGRADGTTSVTHSFWDTQSTGQNISAGGSGAQGVSTAQIQDLNTFKNAGWDIDNVGATGRVWRIYDSLTAPLLRHFMVSKSLNGDQSSSVTYNGSNQTAVTALANTHANWDTSKLFVNSQALGSTLTARNAGTYDTTYYSHQQGYDLIDNQGTFTIDKAQLNLQAASDTRVYDGSTASAAQVTHSALANGDSITGLSQAFDSRNAGSRTLAVNGGYVINDGNGGNNYQVTTATAAGTINQAQLNLQAASDTRVYDSTTQSNQAVTATGLFGTDQVTGLRQSFDSRNAGNRDLLVNGGYVVDDGNGGGNYTVATHKASGTIAKATLDLQAASDSRTYNGTATSNGTVGVSGLFGTDQVTGLSQSFDSRNAGARNLLVNGGYVVNDGNGGGNYTVVTHKASGTIAKATLDLQAASDSRTYNGTNASNGTVGVSGLFGTDQVTGLNQSFDSRNAGARDLLVNAGYVVNDGNGGNNYVVSTNKASGNIAQAKLDAVTGVGALNRAYNGLLGVDLDYSQARIVGTLFGADQVSVAHTGTGTMANKRAGANKQVNIQGLGLSGADAGNYELSDSTAQTQVDIGKASIGSVSGLKGIDRQVNGSNSVAIDVSGAQLSQVVAGDQVFVSGAQGSVANKQVGTHLVNITDIDLAGADADNYEWDFAPTTTTVNIVAVPTVPPTVPPTVAPSSVPQVAFSYANPYQRAIDFDEDRLKNPLNGNPVQIEIIGNGVNTDGIQTLSGELR